MKRNIIILIALIVLFAMPVLASTPEQENAPLSSEDELFLGEMSQLSEQELNKIIGNGWVSIEDPNFHGGLSSTGVSVYEIGIVVYIFFENGLVQEYTTDGAGNLVLNGSYYSNNNSPYLDAGGSGKK